MSRRTAWWVLWMLPLAAGAQIGVSLRLEHSRLLTFEPVRATVTIENQTAAPLYLSDGSDEARLFFDVEPSPGESLARREAPMFVEPWVIPPRRTGTRTFDLLQLYRLADAAPYSVVARVEWDNTGFASAKSFFDLLPGMEIARYRAVLGSDPSARRTFWLRTLTRDRKDMLFLRIDDEEAELCYGVFELGPVVRIYRPALRFDRDDRIHVLHQSAPARFTHSVFTAWGAPVGSSFYNGTAASARLQVDPDGEVAVSGVQPYKGDPYELPSRLPPSSRP